MATKILERNSKARYKNLKRPEKSKHTLQRISGGVLKPNECDRRYSDKYINVDGDNIPNQSTAKMS